MQGVVKSAAGTAIKIARGAVVSRAKQAVREGKHPLNTGAERYAGHRVKSAIPLYGPLAMAGPIGSLAEGYAAAPAAAGPFMESPFPTYCRCSTYKPRTIQRDDQHRVYKCEECAPKAMGLGEYVTALEGRHHGFHPRKNTRKRGSSAKLNSRSRSHSRKSKTKSTKDLK
jgi:hypothetical protein